MPHKDPEARKAYARKYYLGENGYQQKFRAERPTYFRDYHAKRMAEDPEYREKQREYSRARSVRPADIPKIRARQAVYRATLEGELIRPEICSSCHQPGKIEADHHDYSKPLDVTWLCRPCHIAVTKERLKEE